MQLALNPFESIRVDNSWYRRLNYFILGFSFMCFRRSLIELPATDVDSVGQKLVDVTDPEAVVPASPISSSIQPFDYFFDAERT
jgi:hypothetical protein